MRNWRFTLTVAAVLAVTLLTTSVSWADAQLAIGPGIGIDPVVLSSTTSFTVTDVPNNGNVINTLLVFFAVPTGGGTVTAPAGFTLLNAGGTLLNNSTCGNNHNVYDCTYPNWGGGLPTDFSSLTDSDNLANFALGDTKAGLPVASSYLIYVFSDGSISAQETKTFTGFSIPVGTYIVASGQITGDGLGFTPFTTAGLVTTPEPASVMLFGAGLSVLGFFRRKLK